MDLELNTSAEEINRLQRCINDLVAYFRIPKYGQKLYQRPILASDRGTRPPRARSLDAGVCLLGNANEVTAVNAQ